MIQVVEQNERGVSGVVTAGGRIVVRASWLANGTLSHEIEVGRDGRPHGVEREYFDDGEPSWEVPWVDGLMHGDARQFSPAGQVLLRSPFVRGSGFDVFADGDVSEVRRLRLNQRWGVERWGHVLRPWEEGFFMRGRRHGVFRQWRGDELASGFPQYIVDDREVTRREYQRVAMRRRLPSDSRADDARARSLPRGFKQVWLCDELRELLRSRLDG